MQLWEYLPKSSPLFSAFQETLNNFTPKRKSTSGKRFLKIQLLVVLDSLRRKWAWFHSFRDSSFRAINFSPGRINRWLTRLSGWIFHFIWLYCNSKTKRPTCMCNSQYCCAASFFQGKVLNQIQWGVIEYHNCPATPNYWICLAINQNLSPFWAYKQFKAVAISACLPLLQPTKVR